MEKHSGFSGKSILASHGRAFQLFRKKLSSSSGRSFQLLRRSFQLLRNNFQLPNQNSLVSQSKAFQLLREKHYIFSVRSIVAFQGKAFQLHRQKFKLPREKFSDSQGEYFQLSRQLSSFFGRCFLAYLRESFSLASQGEALQLFSVKVSSFPGRSFLAPQG